MFALVSDNGALCVYDIRLNRPVMKTTSAHAGEATSVEWHPSDKFVLATGGGRDRLVKGQIHFHFLVVGTSYMQKLIPFFP